MKVSVKELQATIELKTKGMELEVRKPDGTHLGDLVITKTKLVWCKGKTRPENGVVVKWDKFIEWMQER